jgi:hypothetical protein
MLDFTRPLRTRDNRKVRIYATDAGGLWPIHGAVWHREQALWEQENWRSDGAYHSHGKPSSLDLIQGEAK